MKRRNFISNSSLGLGFLPFAAINLDLSENASTGTSFYYSQSGVLCKDQFVYSGLLQSTNTVSDEDSISLLRSQYNYRTQIKYATNDKFKVEFIKKVLDFFLQSSSLSIKVNRFYYSNQGLNKISRAERSKLRTTFISNLSTAFGAAPEEIINVKSQYAFGSGKYFQEEISENLSNEVKDRIYYEQNLLQLSSFITSIIRADLNSDPINLVNSNILNHLKSSLNVSKLDQVNSNKIIII